MSLKRKLFTAVSMFALTCAMLLVGVWAVSSTSIEIGGTISFSATNVNATVSGSITGASAGTITPTTLEYSSSKTPTTEALNTWKNNLSFDEAGSKITMTITVNNLSSERKLYVTLTDTVGDVTNLSKTVKNGANAYTSGTEVEIATSGNTTFTIEFTVGSTDVSMDGSYGYSLTLTDESQVIELLHDEENDYYYVEMGAYNDAPVRWKVVGVNGNHYTYDSAQAPSGELTFILETITESTLWGNCISEDEADYFNVEYETSIIREYITGHNCAQDANGEDLPNSGSYLNDININPETDNIYKKIKERTIQDLYSNINWDFNQVTGKTPTTTGADKLWIPSISEIYSIVGGETITNNSITDSWEYEIMQNLIWQSRFYWLRSPSSDTGCVFGIDNEGNWASDNYVDGGESLVRPMFLLEV